MGLSTSEKDKALIERIARNLFYEGLIQAEQQGRVIEIINKAVTDSVSSPK